MGYKVDMRPYPGFDPCMGSLERKIATIAIRAAAEGMVGECSDFQILFCAAATHQIKTLKPTLEDLSDEDLKNLYRWIVSEEHAIYG